MIKMVVWFQQLDERLFLKAQSFLNAPKSKISSTVSYSNYLKLSEQ